MTPAVSGSTHKAAVKRWNCRAKQQPNNDALERLDKWLSKGRSLDRWVIVERRGKVIGVALNITSAKDAAGNSTTLAAAIHAALDQAEAKR